MAPAFSFIRCERDPLAAHHGWGGTPCPGLKAKLCLWARSDWLGHCVRTGSAERAGGPKASVCLVPCRRRPCSLLRDGDGLC